MDGVITGVALCRLVNYTCILTVVWLELIFVSGANVTFTFSFVADLDDVFCHVECCILLVLCGVVIGFSSSMLGTVYHSVGLLGLDCVGCWLCLTAEEGRATRLVLD